MALPTASDNVFPKLIGEEVSTPANPAAGTRKLYAKTDGWYDLDDAGVETGPLAATVAAAPFMGCSLTKSATQSITESTSTAVTFNGEEFDTDTLHDNSSNTSRIVLKKVGYWMVGASIAWEATMVDQKRWHMWLRTNGTTTLAGQTRRQTSGTQYQTAQFSRIVQASAITDYVEVMVFQEDTTARSIRDTGNLFWAYFIAA